MIINKSLTRKKEISDERLNRVRSELIRVSKILAGNQEVISKYSSDRIYEILETSESLKKPELTLISNTQLK